MSDIDEEEEHKTHIRESFQLLTQGVEMIHYQAARRGVQKSSKSKKILWLVSIYHHLSSPREKLSFYGGP